MNDPISTRLTPEEALTGRMTAQEFREKLNISEATRKRADVHLPPRRTITGSRYYLPEDILTFLNLTPEPAHEQ